MKSRCLALSILFLVAIVSCETVKMMLPIEKQAKIKRIYDEYGWFGELGQAIHDYNAFKANGILQRALAYKEEHECVYCNAECRYRQTWYKPKPNYEVTIGFCLKQWALLTVAYTICTEKRRLSETGLALVDQDLVMKLLDKLTVRDVQVKRYRGEEHRQLFQFYFPKAVQDEGDMNKFDQRIIILAMKHVQPEKQKSKL